MGPKRFRFDRAYPLSLVPMAGVCFREQDAWAATHPLSLWPHNLLDLILVATYERVFAISPTDPDKFLNVLPKDD